MKNLQFVSQFLRRIGFMLVAIVVILAIGASFSLWPLVQVNPGEKGLVIRLGDLQDNTLDEGIHFKIPIIDRVKTISIRIRKDEVEANAASKDAQKVDTVIAVNWRIMPETVGTVYQRIGDEDVVFDRIVAPAVAEVVKAATAQITAEETLQKREDLKADIDKKLSERLTKYGLKLDDVSIIDITFSEEFNAAIEAKQIAEQESKRARFVADRAEEEAQAAINKAKGEAEAQRLQQQTLTDELLRKMWIEKWDGSLPDVVTDDSDLLMQLPQQQ